MKKIFIIVLFSVSGIAFAQQPGSSVFWKNLESICGKAFEGEMVEGAEDDIFRTEKLIMHVRSCEDNMIRIPFLVGDDLSRTWVLTMQENGRILLKHDHRHEDGSEDEVTQYGGEASNTGSSRMQVFPADQETTDLLPYAASNVWWIELEAGEYFTYNLRRIGTDRFVSVKFDLTKEVETPPAPWGE